MAYKNEPSLQDLISDSIQKKKAVKVKVVKVNKKENTKNFDLPSHSKEIGDEFVDRSQFRNASDKFYNPKNELEPEFLQSLKENFGNSNSKNSPKKSFKLEIPPEKYEMDYAENFGKNNSNSNNKKQGNSQMKNNYEFSENFQNDYNADYNEPRLKKKKHIFRNILIFILIILALICGFLYYKIDSYANLFNYIPDEERLEITNVISDDNIFNILLIGTDTREDGRNGLSDSMILVSINKNTKEIVMSSFMRDINVQIPGYDGATWHKLNWAHSRGGAELLMDTLEFNFGIEIDYYAKVDFLAFADIIDSVGGLDIEITQAEATAMQDPMREQNRILGNEFGTDYLYDAGTYHMNGNQALAYSRIRKKVGDDFARTDRQREVLSLIAQKVQQMDLKELDELAQNVIPNITTNMNKSIVKKLIFSSPFYLNYERISQRIPYGDSKESWDYSTTADGSVIQVDFDKNKQFLLDTIYRK